MNKNDLRFQKTEILIKNTYIKLKKKGSTVVKVKDLCDAAMINKTTFYAHYETIEHLHKAVCKEFATKILNHNPYIDKIETETRTFIYAILASFVDKVGTIEKLYGDDLNALVNDIECVLMERFAESSVSEDRILSIRFCIGGAFRLLAENRDLPRVQKTVALIERVMNS